MCCIYNKKRTEIPLLCLTNTVKSSFVRLPKISQSSTGAAALTLAGYKA